MIEDVSHFDSDFFLLHEEDVRAMDPQALLVLEECLKLLYHAGYTPEEIKGSLSAFILEAEASTNLMKRVLIMLRIRS